MNFLRAGLAALGILSLCHAGKAKSCKELGFAYNSGKGVQQDKKKSIELIKRVVLLVMALAAIFWELYISTDKASSKITKKQVSYAKRLVILCLVVIALIWDFYTTTEKV